MRSANNIFASWTKEDWDRLAKGVIADMKAADKAEREFYASDKCQHIIDRIIANNEGIDNEEVSYFYKKTCKRFGFKNITEDDFQLFFNVMSSPRIGKEDITEVSEDDDNPFPNYNHTKRGCYVYVMSGQGTSISVHPAKKA
jgi:hypothetical protein